MTDRQLSAAKQRHEGSGEEDENEIHSRKQVTISKYFSK
jgi:hypothetical protein